MHPSIAHFLPFFDCAHLPERLQRVSIPFGDLARKVASESSGAETAACLRKLLEAKDCAVRASLLIELIPQEEKEGTPK